MRNFVLLIFLSTLFTSCIITSEDAVIEDFSKPTLLSLDLHGETHTRKAIHLKGEVDDSVYIQMCSECFNFYLTGEIDTVFRTDFSSSNSASFYFYPYKAKSGKLSAALSAF